MVSGVTIVSRPGAVRAFKAVSTHREATPSIIRESQLSARNWARRTVSRLA
jgi:hypothetical protein